MASTTGAVQEVRGWASLYPAGAPVRELQGRGNDWPWNYIRAHK
ncbi:MAG: hypothetical protein OXC19_08390 [Bryobacterales bacterium]|nr:hypothetical protein [Bryobacterales bacterium]